MVAHLPNAFCGAADKLIEAGLVVSEEATCPEGAIQDGGVKDVHGELGNRTLGGVIYAEREGGESGR